MNSTEHYVLVDLMKIEKDPEAIKLFGSVEKLSHENITVEGKPLSAYALRYRLKETGYWKSERYIIKKTTLERSKRH